MQRSTNRGRRVAVAALLLAASVLGACSDDGDDGDAGQPAANVPCGSLGGLGPARPGAAAPNGTAPTAASAPEPGAGTDELSVLLFTRTEEFRHDSIDEAVAWFDTLDDEGIEVTATEETDHFTAEGLAEFDVVAFVNTTGDVLDASEQEAFQAWVEGGGGFVGIHAAADTEHEWAWYGDMVGASFTSHPFVFQTVTLTNEAPDDPTVASFAPTSTYTEEWYNFDRNPRHTSDVLLSIEEAGATYVHNGEPVTEFTQGDDHPVAWSHQTGAGRVWYSNLGHLPETWDDDAFLDHVLGGIRWAADPARYRRTVITEEVDAPVALAVADSGLVLWAERSGTVQVWDPITSMIHRAGQVPSRLEGEGGMMGLRLAPDAAETGHVYVYATVPADPADDRETTVPADPADDTETSAVDTAAPDESAGATTTPDAGAVESVDIGEGVDPDGVDDLLAAGDVGTNALLRLTLTPECTLDLAPERVETLIEVPNQFSGHQGGDIQFLPDGTILLSTGDNTDNVVDSQPPLGGTGVPETLDARRTSGNPDDLRGKILRINPDGSVPEGNLYPSDGSAGRPEVYVAGARNPYRLAVHPDSGRVWFGDIGPDAISPSERGPQGFDELNLVDEPADYGWPYCIADNQPYRRYDLGTRELGEPYDCADKVPALLAYDYTSITDPALGTGFRSDRYGGEVVVLGRSMMAGPWYRPADDADHALPLADTLLLHEFSRNLLLSATVDEAGGIADLRRVAPWSGINTPIDVEVGPDGALYVIEYGTWNEITAGTPAITRLDHSVTGSFREFAPSRLAPAARSAADEVELDGEVLFQANCSSCHGNRGQGGLGPSLQGIGERMDAAEVSTVVTQGRQRMPAWGARLSPEQIEAVVEFVRTLDES